MGAKKGERFQVQEMAISQIRVDKSLQSRVAMHVEHQREFSQAMLRGDVFPPVILFFDGKVYWLADGFHRLAAAKAARCFQSIRAEIRYGAKRDAMIFSAGANIKFSIPRTPADVRKSISLLLEDETCFAWPDIDIAKHVGSTQATVRSERVRFCEERSIPVPPVREYSTKPRYTWLPLSKQERSRIQKPQNDIRRWLENQGLRFSRIEIRFGHSGGPSGVIGHKCILIPSKLEYDTDLLIAISKAIVSRKKFGDDHRCVILGPRPVGLREVVTIAEQLGIEFLTPEELVESIKGKDGAQ